MKLNITIFADTEHKREKGLMHIDKINENDCAFFIFSNSCAPTFWNKNVQFDIDVAFFDKNATLLDIKQLKAHQEKGVGGIRDTKYVIETNSGWFEKNSIKAGTNMWELINFASFKKYV